MIGKAISRTGSLEFRTRVSEFHTPSLFGLLISTGAGRGLISPSMLRRTSTLSVGLLFGQDVDRLLRHSEVLVIARKIFVSDV